MLCQSCGDDSHGVDFFCVAATGQVVDGSVQTQQDGAVSVEAAQTLCDLVADVAGVDVREDEGVGIASHFGVGALDASDTRCHSGVELDLAFDGQVGVQFLAPWVE